MTDMTITVTAEDRRDAYAAMLHHSKGDISAVIELLASSPNTFGFIIAVFDNAATLTGNYYEPEELQREIESALKEDLE